MGKAEKGTPKEIANRCKARGLQKLKFYCQLCEKQCRDENGFQCHIASDSHLRQVSLFASNATSFLDSFSAQFLGSYLDTLKRRHGTSKVNANHVYGEVIQDKHHVHMNSTQWTTLTDFVQYLGKTGKCLVEQTERGWYIQYIQRDLQLEKYNHRLHAEKQHEHRLKTTMEKQRVEAAKIFDRAGGIINLVAGNIDRTETGSAVTLTLPGSNKRPTKHTAALTAGLKRKSVFDDDGDDSDDGNLAKVKVTENDLSSYKTNITSLHETTPSEQLTPVVGGENRSDYGISKEDNQQTNNQQRSSDDDQNQCWLHTNILVRIISKTSHDGKYYYRRKAIVESILDDRFAKVEILDSGPGRNDGGDILTCHREELETVIPSVGKRVRILIGPARGSMAELVNVDKTKYRATLSLPSSPSKDDGRPPEILHKVPFEHFSKIAS